MYPHGAYFGLAPPYYAGFVGVTPVAIPPPAMATPQIVPVPVTVPSSVPAKVEPTPAQYVREKPPVTTVFVGNICDRAPDQLVKTLLMRCGNILSWKRVQGASGKLQAFGFCEYEDPESTMRCVRLLNGLAMSDKKLLVKVDPKTEDLLNEYKKKKQETGEEGTLGATAEEIDSSTQRDDDSVKAALEDILKENAAVLDGSDSPRKYEGYSEGPRHLTMEDMDLDDDRKDLINREIEIFRRRNEREDQAENSQRRPKPREPSRSGTGVQLYSSYMEDDSKEREYRRDRYRSRSKSTESKRTHAKTAVVDEDEEIIRKKLERKFREKEESYQKRLKQWEARERKKTNEYDHERDHERKRQREIQTEAQRLREFFEDYDDTVEDPKYYRGSALHQRLKDRELEEAADERDRQKETEQIEAARRKLFDEKDPNAESIIFQMEQKMQEHLRKRLKLDTNGRIRDSDSDDDDSGAERVMNKDAEVAFTKQSESSAQAQDRASVSPPNQADTRELVAEAISQFQPTEFSTLTADEASVNLPRDGSSTFLFAMSAAEPVVRKKASAFVEDESEDKPKKLLPSWLPTSAANALTIAASTTESSGTAQSNGIDSMSAAAVVATFSNEERNALIKRIIKGIPTSRREVFNYPIDWDLVDASFINSRIKPWVDKKIVGYIGESEATLSNFICDQLLHHNSPERILSDIAMVLDEEAEVFVVKMWRLLIYVIAEKKAGLSV